MRPYPETVEILRILESVLKHNPNHPGAIHYYIHTVEFARPELAEAGADRLGQLTPGAGHLVHIPSHIYRRVGRYTDASRSNELAIFADEEYIAQCRAQGVYPLAYYPHNIHFLWDSATMEGRSQVAIAAARKVAESIPADAWREIPLLHQFFVTPLYASRASGNGRRFYGNRGRLPRVCSGLVFGNMPAAWLSRPPTVWRRLRQNYTISGRLPVTSLWTACG